MAEANPLLAQEHAKVVDLEVLLRQTSGSSIVEICNQILQQLEAVLRAHESYKSEIALLEAELHQQQTSGILDCEMLNEDQAMLDDSPSFHEITIKELQARIDKLELKNKEYLEMFCGGKVEDGADLPTILEMMKVDGMGNVNEEAMALLEESLNDIASKA